jgi:hypothetical protein
VSNLGDLDPDGQTNCLSRVLLLAPSRSISLRQYGVFFVLTDDQIEEHRRLAGQVCTAYGGIGYVQRTQLPEGRKR